MYRLEKAKWDRACKAQRAHEAAKRKSRPMPDWENVMRGNLFLKDWAIKTIESQCLKCREGIDA